MEHIQLGHPETRRLLDTLRALHGAPLGEWKPRAEVHRWVPQHMQEEMLTFLLVNRRRRLFPRDIALMILEFVCSSPAQPRTKTQSKMSNWWSWMRCCRGKKSEKI